jgi:hypothetical protein
MRPRLSDEDVGRQIIGIFMRYRVPANGTLRRNNFFDVRDADFQRGLNYAVASKWIKLHLRDRYTYQFTEAGFTAGWKPEPKVVSEPLQPEAAASEPVTMAPGPAEPEATPLSQDEAPTAPASTDPWKSPA